jgi:hypothetical protein
MRFEAGVAAGTPPPHHPHATAGTPPPHQQNTFYSLNENEYGINYLLSRKSRKSRKK